MTSYPAALEKAIASLKKIPGVGPKSAERMAFFLLSSPESYTRELSEHIRGLKDSLKKCSQCFALTDEAGLCAICASTGRKKELLCVVETFKDLLSIEGMGEYRGFYHVLEGYLSPLDGMTPDKLTIQQLEQRVAAGGIQEVIMATNPNMEGDATAFYIARILKKYPVKVTRLAKGLPVGSDLEFADSLSLANSLKNREEL